jgi:hypothetical protein
MRLNASFFSVAYLDKSRFFSAGGFSLYSGKGLRYPKAPSLLGLDGLKGASCAMMLNLVSLELF